MPGSAGVTTSARRGKRSNDVHLRDAHPHDVSAMVESGRVNPPKQARSEQRVQRVIDALAGLLDGRAFHEISIPEIASESGCGTASIYARFKDKRSILVALYQSVRDQQIRITDELTELSRHEGLSLDESIQLICDRVVEYYSTKRNFLLPAYILGESDIYRSHADLVRHASKRFLALCASKFDTRAGDMETLEVSVNLAIRTMFALLQQRLVVGSFSPDPQSTHSDSATARELASVIRLLLSPFAK